MRDKVTVLLVVLIAAFAIGVAVLGVSYSESKDKIASLQAQLADTKSNALKAERDAYVAGIETCSADDRATFHDAAEAARNRMDKTSNLFKYVMFRYMYNTLTEWSDSWGYSDDTLQSLSDEYMGTTEDYQ